MGFVLNVFVFAFITNHNGKEAMLSSGSAGLSPCFMQPGRKRTDTGEQ